MKTLAARYPRAEINYCIRVKGGLRPTAFFSCGSLVVSSKMRFAVEVLADIASAEGGRTPDDLDFAAVSLPRAKPPFARQIRWKSGEVFGPFPDLPGDIVELPEEFAEEFRLLRKGRQRSLQPLNNAS